MFRIVLACLALAVSAPALADTATLSGPTGGILVNQGQQFVPVQPGTVLGPGDRIMVPAGAGGASLVFGEGCSVPLPPNSLVTLPEQSPCDGGQLIVQQITPQPPTRIGTRPHPGNSWLVATTIATLLGIGGLVENGDDTASP
jgi:hypothetical protein